MKRTSKHVLIADDDESIRRSRDIEADGYQVTTAEDGQVAIESLLNQYFDLAILDLAMPKVNGLLVLKEFQLVRSTEATPVLILTAYGSVDAALESTRYGAVEFLHKPILPDALRSSVRRAIARETRPPLVDHGENYVG